MDPFGSHFHRDRPLEKRNRDVDPMLICNLRQYPFQSPQRPVFQSHLLAYHQRRPPCNGQPGSQYRLYRLDLALIYRLGILADAHQIQKPRRRQQRHTVIEIETAEQVSREEREVHYLHPIGPLSTATNQREKFLESFASERRSHWFL